MKILYLLLLGALLAGCKKNSPDIAPDSESGGKTPITPSTVIEGVKYDNQRVSIPDENFISFSTDVLITLLDTIYKAQAGDISWSILVPEQDSVSARWVVESGIELKLSSSKKWIYKEQMWAHTFSAKIDKVKKSGSAKLGIVFVNHSNKSEISREINVNVTLKESKSDSNGANFGMNKSEAISKILQYFKTLRGDASEWDELLPNIGILRIGKFYGYSTTYEFENNKLVRITEPGYWVSHPDSIPWAGRPQKLIDRFSGGVKAELKDHDSGRYELLAPVSWKYNGLKLGFSERNYTFDGVPGRAVAFTIEKKE